MEEAIKEKIDEMIKQETSENQIQTVSDTAEKAVVDYQNDGIKNITEKVKQGELDMNEAGKELAHVVMAAEAMQETEENEGFRRKFKKKKQEEMLQSANKTLAEEQAKTLTAKRQKAEEFYKSFRPILEMDLSPFLHNDNNQSRVRYRKEWDKSKGKMVKVPIEEEAPVEKIEEPKKPGYEDRSYGIPFMVFILIFLTIPYLIAAVVLSIFNIINAIFVACSKFSKPAFIICSSVAGIALVGMFIYVVLLCIQAAFNVQIIPEAFAEALMINN